MVEIRVAQKDEFLTVKQFYDSLIDAMRDVAYTPKWEKDIYPTSDFLIHSIQQHELYIGEENGCIASCMVVNHAYNDSYNKVKWSINALDSQLLVIHTLGVHPQYARKGIASNMVEYVIQQAKLRNMKTIRLDVLLGNLPAENVYLKLGFTYLDTISMFYDDTGWTDFKLFEYIVS